MRENYAQFQSALAMLDRMYGTLTSASRIEKPNGHRHELQQPGDALIELLEEFPNGVTSTFLFAGTLSPAFNARFSTDLDIVVAPDSKG